jgi:aquaporin related protein
MITHYSFLQTGYSQNKVYLFTYNTMFGGTLHFTLAPVFHLKASKLTCNFQCSIAIDIMRPALFSTFREDCQAAFLEFVGTLCFLFLGLGGIQASKIEAQSGGSDIEKVLYISTSMGFSLLVSVWLFYRTSGGVFNPNIAFALLLVGAIKPVRFVLYCVAQLGGAIAAAGLLLVLTPGPLAVNTTLAPNITIAQGVFIEMIITAILIFAVLMLAVEKHPATPFAPIGIGLTLFVGHLFAVIYTGAGMNTARAFGPAAVTGFPDKNHWVYWIGPSIGAILAPLFYAIQKYYGYFMLNPGQDATRSAQELVRVAITNEVSDGKSSGSAV